MGKAVVVFNNAYATIYKVLTASDMFLTGKVVGGLWVTAKIGNLFEIVTLCYLVVLAAFVVPKVYEMKKDQTDELMAVASKQITTYYNVVQEQVMSKIGGKSKAEKKTE